MGGGDLNLKKSWHPSTLRNLEKVWKAEQKHSQEMAKVEQLKKEIQREKEQSDLLDARGSRQGKRKVERLDWMYSSTAATQAAEKDAIMLGKRAVDEAMLAEKESKDRKLTPLPTYDKIEAAPKNSDLESKMREDPLLAMLANKRKKNKATPR